VVVIVLVVVMVVGLSRFRRLRRGVVVKAKVKGQKLKVEGWWLAVTPPKPLAQKTAFYKKQYLFLLYTKTIYGFPHL